jgi:ElaB/YqjD/DUF883 family membrane-anchored ribosome-binding protein
MKKSMEHELATMKREMKAMSERLAEVLGEAYEEVEGVAEEYAEDVAEQARQKWDSAKHYGRKGRQYVEDHPWQAIGAGVAIGLIIGFLARRRD